MAHSDNEVLESSGSSRPVDATEPHRRLSWDEYSIFYQNVNQFTHSSNNCPVAMNEEPSLCYMSQSNRSANPSPRLEAECGREISPLSPIQSNHNSNGSETSDPEESSSADPLGVTTGIVIATAPPHDHYRDGSRHSMEENLYEIQLDSDEERALCQQRHELDNDDAKTTEEEQEEEEEDVGEEMEAISISLSDLEDDGAKCNRAGFVNVAESDSVEQETVRPTKVAEMDLYNIMVETTHHDLHSRTDIENDMRLLVMKIKLDTMRERMLELNEEVCMLRQRNKELEMSKLQLVRNTAKAMDANAQMIHKLCRQNLMLRKQVNRQ